MSLLKQSQKLIVVARKMPRNDRVPPAFKRRVMGRLMGRRAADFWELWGQALSRAAVCSVALMVVLAVGSLFLPPAHPVSLSQDDVETTLLAAVDNNTDQIGDAR